MTDGQDGVSSPSPSPPPPPSVLGALLSLLFGDDPHGPETAARRAALGAIQKCSLRPSARLELVGAGCVEWCVESLRQHFAARDRDDSMDDARLAGGQGLQSDEGNTSGALSEFSAEFAAALLMNLCLGPEGRARAHRLNLAMDAQGDQRGSASAGSKADRLALKVSDGSLGDDNLVEASTDDAGEHSMTGSGGDGVVLATLAEGLESWPATVRSFVQGSLFVLLSHPGLRRDGRRMGLADILAGAKAQEEEEAVIAEEQAERAAGQGARDVQLGRAKWRRTFAQHLGLIAQMLARPLPEEEGAASAGEQEKEGVGFLGKSGEGD